MISKPSYIFIFYGDIITDPDHGGRKMKFENPKFYFIRPKDEKGFQEFEKFLTNLKNSKQNEKPNMVNIL